MADANVCTFAGSGLCAPDIDAMPAVRWQVCSAHIDVGLDSPRPPAVFATRKQGRYATHLGGHAGKVYALSDVDGYVRVADLWQLAERHGHLIRSCGHRLGARSRSIMNLRIPTQPSTGRLQCMFPRAKFQRLHEPIL